MTYSAVDVEYPVRLVHADGLTASNPLREDRCPGVDDEEKSANEEEELHDVVPEELVP